MALGQILTSGHPLYWDPVTQSGWTSYQVGNQWHETFFEVPTSLYDASQLARFCNFAGVGIWALGMDNNDGDDLAALDGSPPPPTLLQPGPPWPSRHLQRAGRRPPRPPRRRLHRRQRPRRPALRPRPPRRRPPARQPRRVPRADPGGTRYTGIWSRSTDHPREGDWCRASCDPRLVCSGSADQSSPATIPPSPACPSQRRWRYGRSAGVRASTWSLPPSRATARTPTSRSPPPEAARTSDSLRRSHQLHPDQASTWWSAALTNTQRTA